MIPRSVYKVGDARVEIYLAKGLFSGVWLDPGVLEMLVKARGSYRVYGKRPVFDKFDKKSAVYLARAVYPPLEEWLSFRLVPGIGVPWGTGELDIFSYRGARVDGLVRDHFFGGNKNWLEYISSSSRMCGIHPTDSLKHKFSAACYAIVSKHFYDDWLCRMPCRFITGIILNRFVENALTVEIGGEKYGTAFTPAWKVLGARDPKEVRLIRSANSNYAYRFPAYWFNARQLIGLIDRLRREGRVSEHSLNHYLGISRPFSEIIAQPLPVMELLGQLNHLGRLLTAPGFIKHSHLTGNELRALVDAEVDDAPELKITEIAAMKKSVEDFLAAAGAKRIS